MSEQCELTATSSCQPGWTLNSTTGKCEKPPSCPPPGSYNAGEQLCYASGSEGCPTGYTYNSSYMACVAPPICMGGTYSSANRRCEAVSTYSCPDPSYTYNSSSNRCEKAPVCSQGTYNATYHLCLQAYSPSCPTGYTYNFTRLRCEMPPECATGETFNVVTNKCEWTTTTTYPANITGYTCSTGVLNGAFCYTTCSVYDIFGYATNYDQPFFMGCGNGCDQSHGPVMFNGHMSTTCTCSAAPNGNCVVQAYCPGVLKITHIWSEYFDAYCNLKNGTNIPPGSCFNNAATGNLECNSSTGTAARPIYGCNPGDTLNPDGVTCTHIVAGSVNPTCPGGTFDLTNHDCYVAYTHGCPPGTVYDSASDQCSIAPTCTGGLFDSLSNVCYQASSGGCPSGYTLSGTTCVANPTCTPGGTYNPGFDSCSVNSTPACPSSYTYNSMLHTCVLAADCGGGSLNRGTNLCELAITENCPIPYVPLTGNICVLLGPITCPPGGAYSTPFHLCDAGNNLCASPMSYDSVNNVCYEAATCSTGTLNTTYYVCQTSASSSCGTMAWDPVAGTCYTPPVCAPGAYDSVSHECHASVSLNCGTYLWSPADSKCVETIVCPTDPAFPLSPTVIYSPLLKECISDAQHDCLAGLSYISLPVEMCEAVPVCNGGTYDTTVHACTAGYSCPLGAQYNCMDDEGVYRCSPNQCFNPQSPPFVVVPHAPFDAKMLVDDARNPDGSCGGSILIFTGKPSKCRPPGLVVGELNDCCQGEAAIAEDVGNGLQYGMSIIRTVWDLSRIGYYSYMASIGQAQIISEELNGLLQQTLVIKDAAGNVTSMIAMSSFSPQMQAGVTAGVTEGSVVAGTTAYYMQMITSYAAVIGMASMIAMQIMFGEGCDAADVQCAEQRISHECHYVGEYCDMDTLFGCFQSVNTYCCFNSMMARIIQEQGRPQLTTYGPTGNWGSAEYPNCKGLTPEEFEALDFSKIDFSEYIASLRLNLTTNIQSAQSKIQGKYKAVWSKYRILKETVMTKSRIIMAVVLIMPHFGLFRSKAGYPGYPNSCANRIR